MQYGNSSLLFTVALLASQVLHFRKTLQHSIGSLFESACRSRGVMLYNILLHFPFHFICLKHERPNYLQPAHNSMALAFQYKPTETRIAFVASRAIFGALQMPRRVHRKLDLSMHAVHAQTLLQALLHSAQEPRRYCFHHERDPAQ